MKCDNRVDIKSTPYSLMPTVQNPKITAHTYHSHKHIHIEIRICQFVLAIFENCVCTYFDIDTFILFECVRSAYATHIHFNFDKYILWLSLEMLKMMHFVKLIVDPWCIPLFIHVVVSHCCCFTRLNNIITRLYSMLITKILWTTFN